MPIPLQSSEEVVFQQSWKVAADFADHLRSLRARRAKTGTPPGERVPRKRMNREERNLILKKTAGRCHICGGLIDSTVYWEVDHVLSHSAGGANNADNYLPAHGLCNGCRWDHLPEEVQWMMKIGVWARRKMEEESGPGPEMLASFFKYEKHREPT